MNHYILIHRLTGPAILLLLGIVALLRQAGVVHFSIFVPLLLILLGVLKLAERMALSGWEYPAAGAGPEPPGATTTYGAFGSGPTSSSIVPTHDLGNGGNDSEGEKL